MIVAIAPTRGRSRYFIEQPSGRMVAPAEEALVLHRDLEHRNLQTADQRLEGIRQVMVVKDEFKHHRDQVDHVLIGVVDHSRLATPDAHPGQQLFELTAQVEQNGRASCRERGWEYV